MNSWGNVGQSLSIRGEVRSYEYTFRFCRTDGLVRILALAKSHPTNHASYARSPKCFKMFTTRKLKPHTGAVGVPFINSITLLSWTI